MLLTTNHVFHKKSKQHSTHGRVCDTRDFRTEGKSGLYVCTTEDQYTGREGNIGL